MCYFEHPPFVVSFAALIDHFTVMDGSEGDGDLVLTQTFFALFMEIVLEKY